MLRTLYTLIGLLFTSCLYAQTLEEDRVALVALYTATNGDNWDNNTGWSVPGSSGDNPCGWYGITCNNTNDRVTEINFDNNHFQGSLPAEIGNLTALTKLNMTGGSNGIYTETLLNGILPTELGNLVELEYLQLGKNHFSGQLPESLGNLIKLKTLDLNYVPFDVGFDRIGELNGGIPSSFQNLKNLEYLDLSRQNLDGAIPSFVGDFVKLTHLNLSDNQFSGSVPTSFNNLVNLTLLNLSYYDLYLPNREAYGKLKLLPDLTALPTSATIDVSGNSFIFDGIESNVSILDVYNNQAKIVALNSSMQPVVARNDYGQFSAEVGGTLANNTYRWYKNGNLITSNVGDNSIDIQEDGTYRVEVSNALAPSLLLVSESFEVREPLPVQLAKFNIESKANGNLLKWITLSERMNVGFEVEKSVESRSFQKIGYVDGHGNSSKTNTYSFLDNSPSEKSYYRLKQLDNDGSFEYSRIIFVNRSEESLNIYPNPSSGMFTLKGGANAKKVVVLDESGMVRDEVPIGADLKVDMRNFQSGTYFLKIENKTKKVYIYK